MLRLVLRLLSLLGGIAPVVLGTCPKGDTLNTHERCVHLETTMTYVTLGRFSLLHTNVLITCADADEACVSIQKYRFAANRWSSCSSFVECLASLYHLHMLTGAVHENCNQ